MKALLTPLVVVLALSAAGQSTDDRRVRTLFSNPADTLTGGYVAFTGKGFHALGQDGFLLGGRLGMIIGHRVGIGLAGYGLCNPLTSQAYNAYRAQHELPLPDGLAFRMGYGGLFVEPILFDRSVVHLSIPITFGAGGVSYGYRRDGGRYSRIVHTDLQAFYFVEPAVELEVNIIPQLRLGVGASYLYTTDVSLPSTSADILRQPMLQVTLKAGEF